MMIPPKRGFPDGFLGIVVSLKLYSDLPERVYGLCQQGRLCLEGNFVPKLLCSP
jgi:hypothetical protein